MDVEGILRRGGGEGEEIYCRLGDGEITDRGVKSLRIGRGVFIEYYDYQEMSVVFIRLYAMESGDRRWTALYIDENPETPWWTKDERS